MSEADQDADHFELIQRPGGEDDRQSRFAFVVSLAVHLLLLVVLYQHRLVFLESSSPPQALLADVPPEKARQRSENSLEYAGSISAPATIQEPPVPDQPVAAPGEIHRRIDAPVTSLLMPTATNRRSLAGTTLPDRTTGLAALPVEAVERMARTESVSEPLSPADDRMPIRRYANGSDVPMTITEQATQSPSRRRLEAAMLPRAVADIVPIDAASVVHDTSTREALTSGSDQVPDLTPTSLARATSEGLAHSLTVESVRQPRSRDPLLAKPIVVQQPSLARRPALAFARRGYRHPAAADISRRRASFETDAAIELGLEYLSTIQLEDGHWEFQYLGAEADPMESERVIIHADGAATGLALLAFLGAGYDHYGSQYQRNVQAGLDYLVRTQSSDGEIFPDEEVPAGQVARFYGHGISTLALCEAYGLTGDPDLRQPAQAAIDYLAATQHPQYGGWRYVPGTNSDLSVSGWQLVALKSGQLAGLTVRGETYGRLRTLLDTCRESQGDRARYCYNPWASPIDPLTRHGRQPSTVMTSVGMLMHLYLAGDPSDRRLQAGADHLLANLPQLGDSAAPAPTGTLGNPLRDTYYWYYATQVMYRMGGEHWQAWTDRLHPLLVASQTASGSLAGSWDPYRPVPDKWASYGGRLYVTTMNLLSLEVDQRQLSLEPVTRARFAERPEE